MFDHKKLMDNKATQKRLLWNVRESELYREVSSYSPGMLSRVAVREERNEDWVMMDFDARLAIAVAFVERLVPAKLDEFNKRVDRAVNPLTPALDLFFGSIDESAVARAD